MCAKLARNRRIRERKNQPPYQLVSCWLGRQDSNLGMAESKSAALPLGYAPSVAPRAARARDPRGRTIMGPPPAINVRDRPPRSTRAIRRTGDWRPARNDRWRSTTTAFIAIIDCISRESAQAPKVGRLRVKTMPRACRGLQRAAQKDFDLRLPTEFKEP